MASGYGSRRRGRLENDDQRFGAGRAAPLQDMDRQTARHGRQRQPQGSGRGLLRGRGGAERETQRVAAPGSQVQGAQRDRTSDGSGGSVSVSVYLGGGC